MKRLAALVWVATAALLLAAPARAQTSEDEVKATFLYRFASFVTWPADSFASPQAPIVICVIGADPFRRVLERAAAGQRAENRTFEVRRLGSPEDAMSCNIVYAGGERADETLRQTRGRPVLTVTDGGAGRSDVRGIIHFVTVDDRVRFYIDDARAAESNLFMSSRLLTLAVSVRRRADS